MRILRQFTTNAKKIGVSWKNNREAINKHLFLWLILLNLLDLGLTYYGVNVLQAFKEGNCKFKEDIEAGDYSGAIIHKAGLLTLIGIGILYKKGKQNPLFSFLIFGFMLIGLSIYLIVTASWMWNIAQYHGFF